MDTSVIQKADSCEDFDHLIGERRSVMQTDAAGALRDPVINRMAGSALSEHLHRRGGG